MFVGQNMSIYRMMKSEIEQLKAENARLREQLVSPATIQTTAVDDNTIGIITNDTQKFDESQGKLQ